MESHKKYQSSKVFMKYEIKMYKSEICKCCSVITLYIEFKVVFLSEALIMVTYTVCSSVHVHTVLSAGLRVHMLHLCV